MSYTPTTWVTGDSITVEKLNKLEQGVTDTYNVFLVTCTPTAQDMSGTIDKTPAEILEAYKAGKEIRLAFPQSAETTNYFIATTFIVNSVAETETVQITGLFYTSFAQQGQEVHYLVSVKTSANAQTYSTALFVLTKV